MGLGPAICQLNQRLDLSARHKMRDNSQSLFYQSSRTKDYDRKHVCQIFQANRQTDKARLGLYAVEQRQLNRYAERSHKVCKSWQVKRN